MLRGSLLLVASLVLSFVLDPTTAQAQWTPDLGVHRWNDTIRLASLQEDEDTYDWQNDFQQPPEQPRWHHSWLSYCKGVYAGVELVMVKAYWEDEVDRLVFFDPDDPTQAETQLLRDPSYSCSFSPRIYIGYRDCEGFGARVRYWVYNESANPVEDELDLGGIEISDVTAGRLNVQALDLEATKLLWDGRFSLEMSGGARYGRVNHVASFTKTTTIEQQPGSPPLVFAQSFDGRSTFEGVGPTISAEGRHRIGNGPFALVANARGSLLFGQSNFSRTLKFNGSETFINKGRDDLVPIIESQIGAEYVRVLGHGRLTARALMEAQWWGSATPGASFGVELEQPPTFSPDVLSTSRDVGFFGVTAAIIYEF